jgi:hypothetical protein
VKSEKRVRRWGFSGDFRFAPALKGNIIKIRYRMKKPPRLSGTPPKEGKLRNFPSFGGVPNGWGGFSIFDFFQFLAVLILNLMTLREGEPRI